MLITSYYRNQYDNISGMTYDTDTKKFKRWELQADEWSHEYKNHGNLYSIQNDDFVLPGDINYYHVRKRELNEKIEELKKLGFTEDDSMVLTFKKE